MAASGPAPPGCHKPVLFDIIKMMVVVRVRIEHTMFIMHCHPPEEPCIRKLVQGIVNSTDASGTAIVYSRVKLSADT